MPYDRLADALRTTASPTVVTLPDGSVDRFCTVAPGDGTAYESRADFAEGLGGEHTAFRLAVDATAPGGQAVNAASQLHALGADVTCYGHLAHPVFESLPFRTASMGDPAHVTVLSFADRDAMLVRPGGPSAWTLRDLEAVADLEDAFDCEAVCCSNWASVDGLEDAFHRLGGLDLPRVPFVFDPGDVVGRDAAAVEAMHRALAALQGTFDVVFNGNRQEVRTVAAPLVDDGADAVDRLAAIREETEITAAVMHARAAAAVATRDERTRVPNYDARTPRRHTGGGDRFSGGLAHALACGWPWDVALACGNACAVHYVETGETATAEDLSAFVAGHPRPDE